MDKYQNKYRISSTRLQNWDYGWNAAYFVTICTKNRKYWFGNIVGGLMELSEIGKMVNKCWFEIPEHFPFVKLEAFVVMPNHIHGIIIIDKNRYGIANANISNVETQNFASLHSTFALSTLPQPKNKFGPQSKNLASVIRGFKIGVTTNARKIIPNFAWQPRFYDHIIRNEKSYNRISLYIINNLIKWKNDKFNSKNRF